MPALARALPPGYSPDDPTGSSLYRIVSDHLDAFLEEAEQAYDAPLPDYVIDEFRVYLERGQFGPGFLRCHCDGCGHDMLVAFSCKRRGVCPSCATRRMCNEAAHLTDRVLPNVPVRQWVLSLPFELRRLAAFRADVLTMLGRTFVEEIFRASGFRGGGREGGAVTFVQRFGGSSNLNVHFHVLVLDGAFVRANDGTRFHETPPPSREAIATVAQRVHDRAVRWLRRHDLVRSEERRADDASEGTALDACATLALRVAGLVDVSANRVEARPTNPLDARGPARFSAAFEGFDVHAAVRVEANDDEARERLVRYCARPALALDRLSLSRDGAVCYRVSPRDEDAPRDAPDRVSRSPRGAHPPAAVPVRSLPWRPCAPLRMGVVLLVDRGLVFRYAVRDHARFAFSAFQNRRFRFRSNLSHALPPQLQVRRRLLSQDPRPVNVTRLKDKSLGLGGHVFVGGSKRDDPRRNVTPSATGPSISHVRPMACHPEWPSMRIT